MRLEHPDFSEALGTLRLHGTAPPLALFVGTVRLVDVSTSSWSASARALLPASETCPTCAEPSHGA